MRNLNKRALNLLQRVIAVFMIEGLINDGSIRYWIIKIVFFKKDTRWIMNLLAPGCLFIRGYICKPSSYVQLILIINNLFFIIIQFYPILLPKETTRSKSHLKDLFLFLIQVLSSWTQNTFQITHIRFILNHEDSYNSLKKI